MKTFEFRLKIRELKYKNVCMYLSNNIFHKNTKILGELSLITGMKPIYNEYIFKFNDEEQNDNNMFDIINNRIIITKKNENTFFNNFNDNNKYIKIKKIIV